MITILGEAKKKADLITINDNPGTSFAHFLHILTFKAKRIWGDQLHSYHIGESDLRIQVFL